MSDQRKQADLGKLLLRVAVAGLMLFHGLDKLLHGIGGIEGLVQSKGLPKFVAWGVIVGEVIAPLFILVGKYTRPAALVFAFNMVVAVLLAHPGDIFRTGDHGEWKIELQAFYILGALAIALLGAGRFSVSKGAGPMD